MSLGTRLTAQKQFLTYTKEHVQFIYCAVYGDKPCDHYYYYMVWSLWLGIKIPNLCWDPSTAGDGSWQNGIYLLSGIIRN